MDKAKQSGKRGSLSRRRILETALRLIDIEGIKGLSMRRLAIELGVFPTALYYYVPNRDALVRGVVEIVLAEVEISDHRDLGWHERLRALARAFRGVAHSHPRLVPELVAYPEATLEEYGIYESLYGALEEAGLDPMEVVRGSTLLFAYVTGFILAEVNETLGPLTQAERKDLADLSSEKFPVTRRLSTQISTVDLDGDFEFGMDVVISGFAATAARGDGDS